MQRLQIKINNIQRHTNTQAIQNSQQSYRRRPLRPRSERRIMPIRLRHHQVRSMRCWLSMSTGRPRGGPGSWRREGRMGFGTALVIAHHSPCCLRRSCCFFEKSNQLFQTRQARRQVSKNCSGAETPPVTTHHHSTTSHLCVIARTM